MYMHDTLIYNCKVCSQVYDFGVLTVYFNNGNNLRSRNNNSPLFIAVPSMFRLHILYRFLYKVNGSEPNIQTFRFYHADNFQQKLYAKCIVEDRKQYTSNRTYKDNRHYSYCSIKTKNT